MKILALHGLGSSSSMLKEQLRPFIRELGPSCQFVFLDGAISCGRGPGKIFRLKLAYARQNVVLNFGYAAVPAWANGPFWSHATGFTPSEMREAFHRLDEFIRDNGPFDGVLGFSLGAAMAMSYILHQQRTKPDAKPPFCFATLFSPIFVASSDDACYEGLISRLLDDEHALFRSAFPHDDFRSMLDSEDEQTFAEYLRVVLSMYTSVENILPGNNTRFEFFEDTSSVKAENVPRLLHPVLTRDRVRIPTVVVTGEKDVGAMAE